VVLQVIFLSVVICVMSYSYVEPVSLNILTVFYNMAVLVAAEALGDLAVPIVRLTVV
jgi:hypothetical protein